MKEEKEENRSLTKEELFEKIENFSSLFKTLGEDLRKWSNLPHSLTGLDLLLKNALVELEIASEHKKVLKTVCSSNFAFVKKVCAIDLKSNVEKLKTKTGKNPLENLNTSKYIVTWNFLKKNFFGISSDKWEIKSIIEIKESNIEILNKIVEKILKTTSV